MRLANFTPCNTYFCIFYKIRKSFFQRSALESLVGCPAAGVIPAIHVQPELSLDGSDVLHDRILSDTKQVTASGAPSPRRSFAPPVTAFDVRTMPVHDTNFVHCTTAILQLARRMRFHWHAVLQAILSHMEMPADHSENVLVGCLIELTMELYSLGFLFAACNTSLLAILQNEASARASDGRYELVGQFVDVNVRFISSYLPRNQGTQRI
jgi:hypothetical protein